MRFLTRPTTARGLDAFAATGLLLFGLSAVLDLIDGLAVAWYKVGAGVLGGVWVVVLVSERVRRRQRHRRSVAEGEAEPVED